MQDHRLRCVRFTLLPLLAVLVRKRHGKGRRFGRWCVTNSSANYLPDVFLTNIFNIAFHRRARAKRHHTLYDLYAARSSTSTPTLPAATNPNPFEGVSSLLAGAVVLGRTSSRAMWSRRYLLSAIVVTWKPLWGAYDVLVGRAYIEI